MATISKLTVGQILWDVQRVRCGNTSVSRGCLYEVKVLEIAEDGLSIVASWNGNKPRRYSVKQVEGLKVKKPQPKGTVFGLPTY